MFHNHDFSYLLRFRTDASPKAILLHSGVGQGCMYHHFSGKPELARAAIERSAETMLAQAQQQLCAPGTALDKIDAFLQRDRDILLGCRIGRLAQDPEVSASDMLRRPLEEAFGRLRRLLAEVLAQGVTQRELRADLDVDDVAELILSALQGGYVLARAAGSEAPFHTALRGLRAALRCMARA